MACSSGVRPSDIREKQNGVENSGEGKTYHKTPSPQKTVLDPPTYDTFPPICSRPVIYLERTGTDQTNPTCWALHIVRSPPQNARYVLPPHWPFPMIGMMWRFLDVTGEYLTPLLLLPGHTHSGSSAIPPPPPPVAL